MIGSGFGGSVAALRLAEKGYRVAVLERGRRYRDEDFAESAWDLKRFLWSPALGLRGIFRMSVFKDVFVASGSGVGGGSLVWANTMYRAKPAFFTHPQWPDTADWSQVLAPHYATAERMLGMERVPHDSDGQALLLEMAEHFGVKETFTRTSCAVYFGAPGVTVPDPYFGGEGPDRTGCLKCGACMVGCRTGAKNTLVKNYLWFAERLGVEVIPEREVTDIRPVGAADGSDGYVVETEHPGAWVRRRARTLPRGRRGRGRGRAGHQRAARPLRAAGRPAAAQLPARAPGPHQQRIAARRDAARRLAATMERRGDQRELPPGPGHAHRVRHLRQARRRAVRADDAADRRGHAADAAAEVARRDRASSAAVPADAVAAALVAPHADPAGDAVARQRAALPARGRAGSAAACR